MWISETPTDSERKVKEKKRKNNKRHNLKYVVFSKTHFQASEDFVTLTMNKQISYKQEKQNSVFQTIVKMYVYKQHMSNSHMSIGTLTLPK